MHFLSEYISPQTCSVILVEYEINLVLAQCLIDSWVGGLLLLSGGQISIYTTNTMWSHAFLDAMIFFEIPCKYLGTWSTKK